LYYADGSSTGGKLGELSTDGTAHRVLITGGNDTYLWAVEFDEEER